LGETRESSGRARAAVYSVFALIAAIVWSLSGSLSGSLSSSKTPSVSPTQGARAADARAAGAQPAAQSSRATADEAQAEPASDAAAAEPAKGPEPGEHPHPITPAHERIFRENNLVGALNLAVDLEDATKLRELVAQYRAEYPEDAHRLQAGYALIADCLAQLDSQTRERAQRFWETQISSQTRRYVRRYCLERKL